METNGNMNAERNGKRDRGSLTDALQEGELVGKARQHAEPVTSVVVVGQGQSKLFQRVRQIEHRQAAEVTHHLKQAGLGLVVGRSVSEGSVGRQKAQGWVKLGTYLT